MNHFEPMEVLLVFILLSCQWKNTLKQPAISSQKDTYLTFL